MKGVVTPWLLKEFQDKTPGTVLCKCEGVIGLSCANGEKWEGGEHLMSLVPGTKAIFSHYYPDAETRTMHILKIEGKE